MAVKIRLKRAGSRHKPFYKIIVTDSRSARDGASIEALGYYNPLSKPETIEIDEDRYSHWISVGASASEPVETLLRRKRRMAAGGPASDEGAEVVVEEPVAEEAEEAKGEAEAEAAAEPSGKTDEAAGADEGKNASAQEEGGKQ